LKGKTPTEGYTLHWVDRDGNSERFLGLDPAEYGSFRLSPDGKHLAYSIYDGTQWDIHLWEFNRGFPKHLLIGPANDLRPTWSPDSKFVLFSSDRDGEVRNLYVVPADGRSEVTRLTESQNRQYPYHWHTNNMVSVNEQITTDNWDIRILPLQEDDATGWTAGEFKDAYTTESGEVFGSFSPDGNWMVYQSWTPDVSPMQIYVGQTSGQGAQPQISIQGDRSQNPRWIGNEIFFGTGETRSATELQIYIAKYRIEGNTFIPDAPTPWLGATYYFRRGSDLGPGYDIHPDGTRLLVRRLANEADAEPIDHVVLVENFFEILKEKVPVR
jgi:TolB protein